ncbi:2-keto-4-pentenoate hydratase [Dactylosporangium sp. NPDC048998]|uniref:2-keto-4-pentenoate hydratase n=1 Tax=Dactylosporangium sp. NPDC048998 TaxID=3363976 RepID=UPI00371B0338
MTSDHEALLADLAAVLRRAEADRAAIAPLTSGRTLSSEDGYRIQAINTALREAAGERIAGRKVGLTSEAMQRQLGVNEPDFGVLFDSMLLEDGAALALDELVSPRVEAEFAFRLRTDLAGAAVTEAEVRAAVGEVLLALEIIDSRIADWKITLPDTIADNASSARMVAGRPLAATPELLAALPGTEITLSADGHATSSGLGSAVLGDPLSAVVWLVRRLAGFGVGLRAGDVVLAGAVHASVELTPGREVAASATGFETVRVSVR